MVGSLGVSEVMGVRLNHLFINEFSMMNHPAMGMPPLMGKKKMGLPENGRLIKLS